MFFDNVTRAKQLQHKLNADLPQHLAGFTDQTLDRAATDALIETIAEGQIAACQKIMAPAHRSLAVAFNTDDTFA